MDKIIPAISDLQISESNDSCGELFERISNTGLELSDIPQLSDFKLFDKKADGSVADFYIGIELKSGAKCGIKKIFKEKLHKETEHKQILLFNEIFLHAQQNNSYILKLYGYIEDKDYCYLITELGDMDLHYKLTGMGPFYPYHESVALRYIKMIAVGLKSIHEKNIIHKDLKIENFIYFEKEDIIKICDFGLAEHKDQQQFQNTGTVQYRAPELCRTQATEKSDVYSLGICLYVLTHGKYPKAEFFKFNTRLSQEFTDLVSLMCAYKEEDRIDVDTFLVYPIIASIKI
jgi:serine/threonine protein kinase